MPAMRKLDTLQYATESLRSRFLDRLKCCYFLFMISIVATLAFAEFRHTGTKRHRWQLGYHQQSYCERYMR